MTLVDAVLAIVVAGLAAYAVLAGADFGAGFWELEGLRGTGGAARRAAVHRSVGPVWEANHVWLIFVLVVLWTGFPPAFAAIASTLAIPLFLAAVGIILRGAAFAYQPHVSGGRQATPIALCFGVSSVLTPFALGAALGGLASGRVPVGNAAGDALASWINPTSVLAGALAVATGVYLAAVYLAADSARRSEADLAAAFRRRALVAGIAAGALAIGGLGVVRADAPRLWSGLSGGAGLACVAASAACGLAALALVWVGGFAVARAAAAGAVAAIVAGLALALRPDILPGTLAAADAAAGHATLVALVIGVGAGACVLVPSLVLLFRLSLRGDLGGGAGGPEGDG